jgi:hypothetical protein
MDTPCIDEPQTTNRIGDRLILFEAPQDFRLRAGYQTNITLPPGHTFVIIGGYRFKKLNWVRCGIANCKTTHGRGFVVRSAEGLETNIGHCCGLTFFGAQWKEMLERFETRHKEEVLQDVLARVLEKRDTTLKQAEAALGSIDTAAGVVAKITSTLDRYGPVKRAFEVCRKERGSLVYYRTTTEDEREMLHGQTSVRESKGHIDGWHATLVDATLLARQLRFRVIVPLKEIQPHELRALPTKALEKKLSEFAAMADVIQRAEVFIEDAGKLARPSNWRKFELYCEAAKVKMDHQGYRALRTLAGTV